MTDTLNAKVIPSDKAAGDALAFLKNPTIFLSMGLMAIIVMMVLPVPSWILDVGLSASFAFAILIFTITLFIEKPLDFSSFPAVLLASLLLRLSLNVSSTKLIIGQGHTGPGAAGGPAARMGLAVGGAGLGGAVPPVLPVAAPVFPPVAPAGALAALGAPPARSCSNSSRSSRGTGTRFGSRSTCAIT